MWTKVADLAPLAVFLGITATLLSVAAKSIWAIGPLVRSRPGATALLCPHGTQVVAPGKIVDVRA